jgi:alanine racemase
MSEAVCISIHRRRGLMLHSGARRLAAEGAAGFVVALPEEGAALRAAGIEAPILMTGAFPAGGAVGNNLIAAVAPG